MRLKEFYELYKVRVTRVMASATPERRNKISSSNLSVRSGLGLTTVLRSVLCSLSLAQRRGLDPFMFNCRDNQGTDSSLLPGLPVHPANEPDVTCLTCLTGGNMRRGGEGGETKKEKKEENSGVHVGHLDLNLADEPSCYLSARASC